MRERVCREEEARLVMYGGKRWPAVNPRERSGTHKGEQSCVDDCEPRRQNALHPGTRALGESSSGVHKIVMRSESAKAVAVWLRFSRVERRDAENEPDAF